MTENDEEEKKKEKEFDSVQMMREIRSRISQTIRDMDYKTEKEYIEKELGRC